MVVRFTRSVQIEDSFRLCLRFVAKPRWRASASLAFKVCATFKRPIVPLSLTTHNTFFILPFLFSYDVN